jgi:hypothetical protein
VITELIKIEPPKWLMENEFSFNLLDLLEDSLFYPCCGDDGEPVRIFHKNVYSFVYVDYGYTRDSFQRALDSRPFRGFNVIHQQSIKEDDLYHVKKELVRESMPGNSLINSKIQNFGGYDWNIELVTDPLRWEGSFNLDSHPYIAEIKSDVGLIHHIKPFFCEWMILQNDSGDRFSLLYISAEALATYMLLYRFRGISPKVITIIRPGIGYGPNWTDFESEEGLFGQAVNESKTLPEYLVSIEKPWRRFPKKVCQLNFFLNIWAKD